MNHIPQLKPLAQKGKRYKGATGAQKWSSELPASKFGI